MGKLKCDYCGKESEKEAYFLDDSPLPAWVKHQKTGEMTCPECFEKGATTEKLVEALNTRGGDL